MIINSELKHTFTLLNKLKRNKYIGDKHSAFRIAARISTIYMIIGSLWILLSDKALALIARDKDTITFISMIKGWVYVLVTGLMIFFLIKISFERIISIEKELEYRYKEIEKAKVKHHNLKYHDSLTGLKNRYSLMNKLSKMETNSSNALLFIDSDNFKLINDTYGYSFGDELIITIGKRLSEIIETSESLYRIGGDEFIILLNGYQNTSEVKALADKIIESFKIPFLIGGSTLHITVSIGISLCPENAKTSEKLLMYADMAMYKSKAEGRNRYTLYNSHIYEAISERMLIEEQMHFALSNDEFHINYQPQLDINTGKITGFEALLRWKNPKLGMIPPLKFIKVAEDTHMIIPIGYWVIENSCRFIKRMHQQGYDSLVISINISVLQLLQNDFVHKVMRIVDSIGIKPDNVELEITETILMESHESIGYKLEHLRQLGFRIALDDFGQGYSSLNYLRHLPITTLKIDKSFIDGIDKSKSNKSLAGSIVMIGRKMGLTVLAEGVETKEQLEFLTKHKCHKIQGYYFSRPLPEKEAYKLLKSTSNESTMYISLV